MAKLNQKHPLDYRPLGDTVDNFAQKYNLEIPLIYEALNNIRVMAAGSKEPEPYQLKAENDILYIRNKENTDWIVFGEVKAFLGIKESLTDKLLTEEKDVATEVGQPNKLVRTNASGKFDADITGNAGKIANKEISAPTLEDGNVLVYRESEGKFVPETKGAVGTGKKLIINQGDDKLGEYTGEVETTVNIKKENIFTGATTTTNGTDGLVPQPVKGNEDKFLKGDGTWSEIPKYDLTPYITKEGDDVITGNKSFENAFIRLTGNVSPPTDSNQYIYCGNDSGDLDHGPLNITLQSWNGIGFFDSCVNKKTTIAFDVRNGRIRTIAGEVLFGTAFSPVSHRFENGYQFTLYTNFVQRNQSQINFNFIYPFNMLPEIHLGFYYNQDSWWYPVTNRKQFKVRKLNDTSIELYREEINLAGYITICIEGKWK